MGFTARTARFAWALACCCVPRAAAAADVPALTAATIVARARAHTGLGLAQATATVTLVATQADGSVRRRHLTVRSRRSDASVQTLVRLLAPPDVAGTGFLASDDGHGSVQQYLYLPALAKTKRITGRQRDEPFLGTDLRLGDLQAEQWRDADLARLADTEVAGSGCYVIEARPRAAAAASYALTRAAIHREALVPVRVEFFAADGQRLRTLRVTRLARRPSGWLALASTVTDHVRGSSTQVSVDAVDADASLSDADFTLRALAEP